MENKPDALTKTSEHTKVSEVSKTIDTQVVELKKLSDALEKRAQSTVDKLEKVKYQKLIDELSKSWDAQSDKVSTGARDLQAELRARITPDQQKLLDDTRKQISDGTQSAIERLAPDTKVFEATVSKNAQSTINAIKTGDYSEIKKISANVTETVNAAGEKVLTYGGLAGLSQIFKPLTEEGRTINFSALFANLWKFFTGDFKYTEVLDGVTGNSKEAVNKAATTAEKSFDKFTARRDEVWGKLIGANTQHIKIVDPAKTKEFNAAWDQYVSEAKSPNGDGGMMLDDKKEIDFRGIFNSEKQSVKNFVKNLKDNKVYLLDVNIEYSEAQEKIWKHLVASGWISPEDAWTKRDKFNKMMQADKYQKLLDPLKAVKNNENWNLAEAVGNAGSVGVGFMFDLNRAGVIPLSAIGAYMIDWAVTVGLATTKFLLNHSVDQFVYTVSGQSLEDINARPQEEKRVLMSILYHNMSLQLYMTGLATKMIATAGLMGLYWEQGTGITAMKWQFHNALGQYDAMSKTLEHLAADTLKPKEAADLKAFDTTVREFIAKKSIQFKLVDIYRNNPKATPQELVQLIEKWSTIDGVKNPQIASQQKAYLAEVVTLLKKETTEAGFKKVLSEIVSKNTKTVGITSKIVGDVKGFFTGADQQSSAHFDLERADARLSEALVRWVTEKWTAGDWMLKVGRMLGYGSPAEFISAADKSQIIINAKNPEAAIKTMQNVVKEIPSGLHNMFFKAFPVAIAVHDSWKSDDKLKTFLIDVASANPLYGFTFLFVEWWNLKGANLTHPGYLMAATTAGAFTAVELAQIMMSGNRGWNLARFAISPAIMVKDTLGMATRATQNAYRFARASSVLAGKGNAELWKLAGELTHAKWRTGLVALGVTVATMLPIAAFNYADQKRMGETLSVAEKRWILNPETWLVVTGVKNSWQEWTATQKEDLVRMSSVQILGENVANCSLDPQTGKIVATLDAPKKTPENTVVGISSANDIKAWKLAMQSFGLTPEIAYSRNADQYLLKQFKGYSDNGVPSTELTKFQSEIEWTLPDQA